MPNYVLPCIPDRLKRSTNSPAELADTISPESLQITSSANQELRSLFRKSGHLNNIPDPLTAPEASSPSQNTRSKQPNPAHFR